MPESTDPHYDPQSMEKLPVGQVLAKHRGEYFVLFEGHEIVCGIRSRLRKDLVFPISRQRRQGVDQIKTISQVDPIAVGDFVRFVKSDDPDRGVIEHVEERKNQVSRQAPGPKPLESVICANVDNLILVFSLSRPTPKVGFIDRILVVAEWECIPPVIVFNKKDEADPEILENMLEVYKNTGYQTIVSSAFTCDGIEQIIEILKGKTSVLIGPSGVGKSSILNAIQPGLALKAREISESTGKGTHTTTHLEAFLLDIGGLVVDTPGIKQLAMWNLGPDELVTLYPEMEPLAGKCKFGMSCLHETEPGCAIKQAVKEGKIHQERYESYLRMRSTLKDPTKNYENKY